MSQGLPTGGQAERPRDTRVGATSANLVATRALEELAERYAPPSLVINAEDSVVHFQGDLNPYLRFPKGRAELYVFDMLNANMRAELRALIYRCRRELITAQGSAWPLDIGGKPYQVTPTVSPLERGQNSLLIVSFLATLQEDGKAVDAIEAHERDDLIIKELEHELANARTHLNIVVEELETSNEELQSLNEELQSTNEELQSTNEELQTSNEELQSTNEELLTVNEELQARTAEVEAVAGDLINVKESLALPLIVVDRKLRITQANDACASIVFRDGPLEQTSLNTVQWRIEVPGLSQQVRGVIRHGANHSAVVKSADDEFSLRIMPYRLHEGEIAGAVLLFEKITERRRAERQEQSAMIRLKLAAELAAIGIWVWDLKDNSLAWDERMYEFFQAPEDVKASGVDYNFWLSHCHPDDARRLELELSECIQKKKPWESFFRIVPPDGGVRYIQSSAIIETDDHGKPCRFVGVDRDVTLQAREQDLLRQITSMAPYATVSCNPSGCIVLFNAEAERLFGYSQEEVIGRSVESLLPSAFHVENAPSRAGYLSMGRGQESNGVRKNGETFPAEIAETPIETDEGRFVMWTIIDITDRKDAHLKLKRSEERFRSLIMATNEIFWSADAAGGGVGDSPDWRIFTGQSAESTQGFGWTEALHPEDRKRAAETWAQAIETCSLYDTEYRVRRHDGVYRDFIVRGVPVFEPGGDVREWVGACKDITERKQLEMGLLREREHFLRTVTDNFPGLVGYWTKDLRCAFANPNYLEWFGRSAEEMIGTRFQEFMSEKDFEARWSALRATLAGEAQQFEGTVAKPDGSEGWLWMHYIPDLSKGECAGFFVVAYDITERKRAEQGLRSALDETNRLNHLMDGRESQIVALKQEINQLALLVGKEISYPSVEHSEPVASSPLVNIAETFEATIDVSLWQRILDAFCDAIGISAGIVDVHGKVLVGSRWQKICTDFHHACGQSLYQCIESDARRTTTVGVDKGIDIHTCRDGMTIATAPIIIDGSPVGSVFIGQFLTSPPDREFFTRQARTLGYDIDAFLKALDEAPVLPSGKIEAALEFVRVLSEMVSLMAVDSGRRSSIERMLRSQQTNLLSLAEDAERARLHADAANRAKSDFLANMSHENSHPYERGAWARSPDRADGTDRRTA